MKYLTVVVALLAFSISCKKDIDLDSMRDEKIKILGHGGMGFSHIYPGNTVESVKNCLNLGADGTEIDIQMTRDSVLIAFHDEYLDQTTNGAGQIYNHSWSELKDVTYQYPPFTEYKVITLDELFAGLENPGNHIFFLDCKTFNPDYSDAYVQTFTKALLQFIDKYNLGANIYIELKRLDIIRSLKDQRPELKLFLYKDFEKAFPEVIEYDLEGITRPVHQITKQQVAKAHQNGILIAVFNSHSHKKDLEAIEKNVDFIQTDRVEQLIKATN